MYAYMIKYIAIAMVATFNSLNVLATVSLQAVYVIH